MWSLWILASIAVGAFYAEPRMQHLPGQSGTPERPLFNAGRRQSQVADNYAGTWRLP